MPMPQYHSCRLEDPKGMTDFHTVKDAKSGKMMVYAHNKDGKNVLQSIKMDKDMHTEEAARKSCEKMGGKFEASSGTSSKASSGE